MPQTKDCKEQLLAGEYDSALRALYLFEEKLPQQKERYAAVLDSFVEHFGDGRAVGLYSAPGRTEVCGNHTDHNHGRVLAAGIDLDAIAAAAPNEENIVRVKSAGYDMDVVDLSDLAIHEQETGHSASLVRGICAQFRELGYRVGGFDAATASKVLSGSGLSSSAAFEVLLCTILNYLYNDGAIDAVTIAQISQSAENIYFGKPCGLMDQMACSVGGFVTIDFCDPVEPVIEKVDFDFSACRHALCIVDTGGDHADLTDDYAAVRGEMESVASEFGCRVLREVDEAHFLREIPALRSRLGDRAVLRAMHFYADNARVLAEVDALRAGDFESFKAGVIESGRSSYMYNQNVFTCKQPSEQPVSLALAVSERLLAGKGAWRVHGGGFAGTIQAFVPVDLLDTYRAEMERIFGANSCYVLNVRPAGGAQVVKL